MVTPFQQIFASNIPLIGAADPRKVVEEKKKKVINVGDSDGKTMDEKWASLLAESSGVSLDDLARTTPSKGGKKRSKKS